MERLVRFGNQFQASASMATNSLFGASTMPDVKPPSIPDCPKWELPELLDREKEVVGIYLSAHPLDGFKFEMEHYNITPTAEIESNKGRSIRIAGFVTDAAHMTTKKGSKFGKMMLNDYSGHQEIVLWENNYVQYGKFISEGQKLMIQGTYKEHRFRPGVMEFEIQNMMLLDQVRKSLTKKLHILLPANKIDNSFVSFMAENVKTHPGNTELLLQIVDEEGMTVKLKSHNMKIEVSDELIQYLQLEEASIRYSLEVT